MTNQLPQNGSSSVTSSESQTVLSQRLASLTAELCELREKALNRRLPQMELSVRLVELSGRLAGLNEMIFKQEHLETDTIEAVNDLSAAIRAFASDLRMARSGSGSLY
jgi:hypothetical protein